MTKRKVESAIRQYGHFNKYLAQVSEGLPVREFQPLKQWPVAKHTEQARIDEFLNLPSRYAK